MNIFSKAYNKILRFLQPRTRAIRIGAALISYGRRRIRVLLASQGVVVELIFAKVSMDNHILGICLPIYAVLNSTALLCIALPDYKRERSTASLEARVLMKVEILLGFFGLAVGIVALLENIGVFGEVHIPCSAFLVSMACLMLYYQILREENEGVNAGHLIPIQVRRH